MTFPFRLLQKFKAFFSRLLFRGLPDVPEPDRHHYTLPGHLNTGGIFSNSHNFVVSHSTMVLNVQGEYTSVSSAMMLLSGSIILGAEHDSSSRDPPPRCHPGTRTRLIEGITTWFEDGNRRKSLLWINGPAGVGKSAIVQTLTESLASSQRLGAAIFFSRLNKRNDPRKTFITVAYQLAVRIPDYRTYVTERLILDPSLVDKGLKEQFQIFIVEPFTQNRVSPREKFRVILLDGMDECTHQNQQCEIIRLIGAFTLHYPDVPLLWVIASRPEPHISITFADESIANSHWQEFVPVDATDACKDVERYLTARFQSIRGRFPFSAPTGWPSEVQYLKLSRYAAGLFVFAETAAHFIDDGDIADPVSQLDLVLSILDKSVVVPTDDQPFTALDALYTQILALVPSRSWVLAKKILGFTLCSQREGDRSKTFPLHSRGLVATAEILGLDNHVIYGSLHKLHSVLVIPPPKKALSQSVAFIHASFADFLTDSTRAKAFFIDSDHVPDAIIKHLFDMMQNFVESLPPHFKTFASPSDGCPVYQAWVQHCDKAHSCESWGVGRTERHGIFRTLFRDVQMASFDLLARTHSASPVAMAVTPQQSQFELMETLARINTTRLYTIYFLDIMASRNFHVWITRTWKEFSVELNSRGLVEEVQLKDLTFDHLNINNPLPNHFDRLAMPNHFTRNLMNSITMGPHTPRTSSSLQKYISTLKNLQKTFPELQVLIVGSSPAKRSAFFCCKFHNREVGGWSGTLASGIGYYCVPYGR